MEYNNDLNAVNAAEPAAMTYGMSQELLNSGILDRVSRLSASDKRCLMRYISEDVAKSMETSDEWDNWNSDNIMPYSIEELQARIEEAETQYQKGEYYTAAESNRLLKEKYLWLQ